MKTNLLVLSTAVSLFAYSSASYSCASCGCSLNTDWNIQGMTSSSGFSFDVRYDYLNQNQLLMNSKSISSAVASTQNNTKTNSPAEVEQYTKNNYLTTTIDYSNGSSWGASLVLPYINREHSTLGTGSDGMTFDSLNGAYKSSSSGMGDIKLIGRYFGFSPQKNFGVQFGLKLPTGQTTQVSNSGSITPVDPGLQMGTGTTDLILGLYYFDKLTKNWDYFAQATYQTALNSSTMAAGSYHPGDGTNLNAGVRYQGFDNIIPMLQINARYSQVDSGDAADTFATGGTLVYLTPGLVVPVSPNSSVYANIQLPIYQNVNGIQLTPEYILSTGARFQF